MVLGVDVLLVTFIICTRNDSGSVQNGLKNSTSTDWPTRKRNVPTRKSSILLTYASRSQGT